MDTQLGRRIAHRLAVLVVGFGFLNGSFGHAQVVADAFGTADATNITIVASAFAPRLSTQGWEDDDAGYRTATGSPAPAAFAIFRAGIEMPSGAEVVSVVLHACDTDPVEDLVFAVLRCSPGPYPFPGSCARVATGNTSSNSGCFTYTASGAIGTINAGYTYMLEVEDHGSTAATRFQSMRVRWRRTVSNPPFSPTFSDVHNTHFAYRFIEALAKAGITGGCGGTQYCPDAPVTRAEMAVFMATALGLHWPD